MAKVTTTKAMLQEMVDSLPDDLPFGVYVDMGTVIRWMASERREWTACGTDSDGKLSWRPWHPSKRRCFIVFEPGKEDL